MQKLMLCLLLSSMTPMLAEHSQAHVKAQTKTATYAAQIKELETKLERLPKEITDLATKLAHAEASVGSHETLAQKGAQPTTAHLEARSHAETLKARLAELKKQLAAVPGRIAKLKRSHALAEAEVQKHEMLKQEPVGRIKKTHRTAKRPMQKIEPVLYEGQEAGY